MIECRGVAKRYSRSDVLRDVTFDVARGRVHALLGRNGAGKSMLFSILLGLIEPTAGEAIVRTDKVGASLNGPAFYGHLSARDNLRVHTALQGLPQSEADHVLELVGLKGTGRKKAKHFSTGMKARLALAQTLLGDPELLILDEPQNGLDPQGIADLRAILRRYAAAGHTVLVSSHQLGEVVHLADDATVIAHGTVRYTGALTDLAPSGQLEDEFFRLTAASAPDGDAA